MLPRTTRQIDVVPVRAQSEGADESGETEQNDKHPKERGSLRHR